MSRVSGAVIADRSTVWSDLVQGCLPAAALVCGSALVGPFLGAAARPLFILGCVAIGWLSWRRSPATHVQAMLILFSFAPFVRRIVDFYAGFDPSGTMLVGPMLALVPPALDLLPLLDPRRRNESWLAPYLLYAGCLLYALLLTLVLGELSNVASSGIKWGAPLLYAVALRHSVSDPHPVLVAATKAFMVILPITGIYGILQYVDPPLWDQYWLLSASITSAGRPEPYEVRVFSTLNGPASFATFTAVGLFLVYFRAAGWRALVVLPAALALMLSLYRTAWVGLAGALIFCLFFPVTRLRAVRTLAIIAAAIVGVTLFTPFGEVITERLATLTDAANDDSGEERLDQYAMIWSMRNAGMLGQGFTTVDTGSAGSMAIDGMIISCWFSMGLVVGLICLASLIHLAVRPIGIAMRRPTPDAIALGALACGFLIQLPLASISTAELGFLFWTIVTLAEGVLKRGVTA